MTQVTGFATLSLSTVVIPAYAVSTIAGDNKATVFQQTGSIGGGGDA